MFPGEERVVSTMLQFKINVLNADAGEALLCVWEYLLSSCLVR